MDVEQASGKDQCHRTSGVDSSLSMIHWNHSFQQLLKVVIPMKSAAVIDQAKDVLLGCLKEVPFVTVQLMKESKPPLTGPDFQLRVKTQAGTTTLIVDVRSVGQPRVVREATNQLARYRQQWPEAYGVVIAPYISPKAAAICREEGVGFADLAGNCSLAFDPVFISKEGKENPFSRKRDLRSMYSPKAERVLRVLLGAPQRWWKAQSLAKEAGVSLGQGFNVKKLLMDREWIEAGDAGFRLAAPAELLAEWEGQYDFRRSVAREFYTLRPIAELEGLLAETCDEEKTAYALAGFSSAARYAPMVRYQRAMAYVSERLDRVAERLELKPVTSGANVILMTPYDDGVFYGAEKKGGVMVTSPVQTYLDLRQIKGRGDEAAEFLKHQVIENTWQGNESIIPPPPWTRPSLSSSS